RESLRSLLASDARGDASQVAMQLHEMVQRVAQAYEAGSDRRQVRRLQRERFEEGVDLLDRVGRRVVRDGGAAERAANRLDRAPRDLEDRPPGGLERDGRPRIGQRRIEAAEGRLATRSGYPDDQPGEAIDPRIE